MPATRNIFQKIPFIRITGLFLIGILLRWYQTLDLRIAAILCTTLISALIFLWRNSNYSAIKIQNLLISVGIILAGVFYSGKGQERPLPSFDRKDYFLAEVCQKPAEKARTYQTVLRIQNKSLIKPEKLIAYFSKTNFDPTITTGDQLILLARPQKIRNSGNPYEIDYQSMMHKNDIWFSVYLTEGTYLKTENKVNRLGLKAEQYRDKLISLLTTSITEKEERSVVSALTLGYRTEIDQETIDYFASTGAMHVLSVSGLHVALIYFILGFLLSFIKRGKAGSAIFAVLMISFLWIYAFISGFSPSVQRATVMFSFLIIGNLLRRPANIYNTLMASALFLILLNPLVIYDIGFQLSYLAVFGIITIQPVLYKLIEVTNPIIKWVWSLTTVSIAAQLTTFPLGLYYFNQFPNLFWLSNFIVIPATTLIIWLTLAFFIVSPVQSFGFVLGIIIQKITHIMLYLLKALDELPYAVSQGIVLTLFQVLLLFACITFVFIFFASKQKVWLLSGLVLILLFQVNGFVEKYKVLNQKAIIVYNSKNTLIHLINGRKNYLITNGLDTIPKTDIRIVKQVENHSKIDTPIIINRKKWFDLRTTDLVINPNTIQFLCCELELSYQSEYNSRGTEIIKLKVQNSNQVKNIIQTLTMGGTSSNRRKKDPTEFNIKNNGAYSLKIN
ncbi:MAG: ComEC/Rec2 family competence protein [Bacteroidota bacterium]|nr:ComEC/Rec2 family competence protein [Bacteroidota bacterium]